MRRILFTVTTDLTYDQRMERICSAMAGAGYSVTIVGRVKQGSLPLTGRPYRQVRLRCFFETGKLFYLEFNIRLLLWLLFTPADIISSVDLDTILPGFLVARIRRKIFVYDAHEYFTEVIEVVNRPQIKKIWETVERFVLKRIRYAYTVSDGLKREFEKKYPVKFEVIRNVPYLSPVPEQVKTEKYIIYIGVVNEGRGLEALIDVMEDIPYPLYICGEGDLYREIESRVKDKKLEHKVKLFGYVVPEQLKELTRNAYIGYLMLDQVSLSYYYSLANKFFDYIHAGIPQLVVDFPEYRTINEKFEVALLCRNDRESIREGMLKLLEDPALYERLRQNTGRAKEAFNWQRESEKLVAFYEKTERARGWK